MVTGDILAAVVFASRFLAIVGGLQAQLERDCAPLPVIRANRNIVGRGWFFVTCNEESYNEERCDRVTK